MTDSTRFILLQPSHPGNVGAVARAMKVMGFRDLVLVAPRFADVLVQEETVAMASGAADILVRARVVPTFAEALDDITFVCATAMTPRDFGPPTHPPRALFASLAGSAHRVAFAFGPERHGMSNEDVYRCHAALTIPTDPAYGSLNLAQAVQVIAYDWRQALGGFGSAAAPGGAGRGNEGAGPEAPLGAGAGAGAGTDARPALASARAVQGLLQHWEQALVAIDFLDPAAPKKLMPRLNQLFNRAGLQQEEVHILRGIAKAMMDRRGRG